MASQSTREPSTCSASTATHRGQVVQQEESSTNRLSTLARVQSISMEDQRAKTPVNITSGTVGGGVARSGGVIQGDAGPGDHGAGNENKNQPVSTVLPKHDKIRSQNITGGQHVVTDEMMEVLLISNVQNNLRRWLAMAALACMWSNAQVPLYMFGTPFISASFLTYLLTSWSQLAPRSTYTPLYMAQPTGSGSSRPTCLRQRP